MKQLGNFENIVHLVWYRELIDEIKVEEHAQDYLQRLAVLVQGVIELVAVEVEVPSQGDGLPREPGRVVVRGGGVVGQAVQGNSLQQGRKQWLGVNLTCQKYLTCFAMSLQVLSYVLVLWIPIPQNIANASIFSTSFSSKLCPLS